MGVTSSSDDAFILDMIRKASAWTTDIAHRTFVPQIETRLYDAPTSRTLKLDRELLSLATLTNGDGTTVPPTDYLFAPANETPKHAIKLKTVSTVQWYTDTNASREQVISVAGVWGHTGDVHQSYADSWIALTTLSGAVNDSATALALTAAGGKAGQLWRIDSEIIYAATVSGTSASVIARGVNGSIAASHLDGATIYSWNPSMSLQLVVQKGAYGLCKLRDNPEGERIVVDGIEFATLKDVHKQIESELAALALIKRW